MKEKERELGGDGWLSDNPPKNIWQLYHKMIFFALLPWCDILFDAALCLL
jgi:hypothetical protein